MRIWRALAAAPAFLANSSSAPAGRGGATHEVASATVEVGRVFGQGGTDGLILYALVLSTFLMFLIAVAAVLMGYRAIEKKTRMSNDAFAKKDEVNAEQTKMFIASMDRTAAAVGSLSVSVANDLQERAATAAVLARIEGTDQRMIALLEQLNHAR